MTTDVWRECVTCAWPNGRYQHSRFCIPEPVRRAEADKPYHRALEELDLTISAISGRRPESTAALVREMGWEGRWHDD